MKSEFDPERFIRRYEAGNPPWVINRPQPVFRQLADKLQPGKKVLDAGCGTGDNSIYFASKGFDVWGIDLVPQAINLAEQKLNKTEYSVHFVVHDLLKLDTLLTDIQFDFIIDSGVFHAFSDSQRKIYVEQLTKVIKKQGKLFLMCYNEFEDREGGTRRVTQAEIRESFSGKWKVNSIIHARFGNNHHETGARAWFAEMERV